MDQSKSISFTNNTINDGGEIIAFNGLVPVYHDDKNETSLIYLSDDLFILIQFNIDESIFVVYFRNIKKVNVFNCIVPTMRSYYVSGKILSSGYIYDLEGNILNKIDLDTCNITNLIWYKTKLIGFTHDGGPNINLLESIVEVTINDDNQLIGNKFDESDINYLLYNNNLPEDNMPFSLEIHHYLSIKIIGNFTINFYNVVSKITNNGHSKYIGELCYINYTDKIMILFDDNLTYTKYNINDNTSEIILNISNTEHVYFSYEFDEFKSQLKFAD